MLKTYHDFRGKEKYNAVFFDFFLFEFGAEIVKL